jgi:hypothetical protein
MIEAGNTYVALGSSFAAGPGIEPIVDVGARMNGFRLRRLRRSAPCYPTPAGMSAVADLVLTLLRDQRTT